MVSSPPPRYKRAPEHRRTPMLCNAASRREPIRAMVMISLVKMWGRALGAAVLAAVAGALLLGGGPAGAQVQRPPVDETFTIADVPVDVTDTNAIQARERALAEGQRQAFQRLVQRLSTE